MILLQPISCLVSKKKKKQEKNKWAIVVLKNLILSLTIIYFLSF